MARLSINRTDRWHVKHDRQDIRGWPARDASGDVVAHVQDLIADTDSNMVESVVLDSGNEVPASQIEISDGSIYLGATSEERATGRTGYRDAEIREREPGSTTGFAQHEPAFREHHRSSFADSDRDYSHYHPAYRLGYDYGTRDEHRQRSWDDVEPDLRRRYEETRGSGGWQNVKDAARHAFQKARSGSSTGSSTATTTGKTTSASRTT